MCLGPGYRICNCCLGTRRSGLVSLRLSCCVEGTGSLLNISVGSRAGEKIEEDVDGDVVHDEGD